jgi:transcriptional regulator with XRE-family HTH domain
MARERQEQEPAMVLLIREAIRASGLTISELARRSGVSHPQISRFVHGERTLTLPAAARVCAVLGLELTRREGRETGHRPSSEPPPEQPKAKGRGKKGK